MRSSVASWFSGERVPDVNTTDRTCRSFISDCERHISAMEK